MNTTQTKGATAPDFKEETGQNANVPVAAPKTSAAAPKPAVSKKPTAKKKADPGDKKPASGKLIISAKKVKGNELRPVKSGATITDAPKPAKKVAGKPAAKKGVDPKQKPVVKPTAKPVTTPKTSGKKEVRKNDSPAKVAKPAAVMATVKGAWGGRREGAGTKPKFHNKVRKTTDMEQVTVKALHKLGVKELSPFLNYLAEQYVIHHEALAKK